VLDAREEIHGLVDEINRDYGEFGFTKDFVLKCSLMLADLDLRWRVENFNHANMAKIEELWPKIADAIRLTVRLPSSFGFSEKALTSANSVIPITYYLFRRDNPTSYVDAGAFQEDRKVVRTWLNIVLLKRTFGGVPDNVLRMIRDVLRETSDRFPADRIADALRSTKESLDFGSGELEAIADYKVQWGIHVPRACPTVSRPRFAKPLSSRPHSPQERFHSDKNGARTHSGRRTGILCGQRRPTFQPAIVGGAAEY
jgi:hypothetical protein